MRPIGDHFYTTSQAELNNAVFNLGYVSEGTAGFVLKKPILTKQIPLYRLWNSAVMDHFYTVSQPERDRAVSLGGYKYEGIACNVLRIGDPDGVPLFRLYNPGTHDHFYTVSTSERDNAIQNLGYQSEGEACRVPTDGTPNSISLYRLFEPNVVDHFYTTNAAERDNAVNLGYNDEGVACAVFPQTEEPSLPLYRSWKSGVGDHFYTVDIQEHVNAVKLLGYNDEGIACYVLPKNGTSGVPFHRSYNSNSGDHFYTISLAEHQNAISNLGYVDEDKACNVYAEAASGRVPLLRAYKRYGARVRLHVKIVQNYVYEGIACYVLPPSDPNGIDLYRAYSPGTGDHFYTTSASELANAVANFGYINEGVACRVPSIPVPGTTFHLYRSYNPVSSDHFYTTSETEHQNAVLNLGYNDEGIACDVYIASDNMLNRIPLFRMYNHEVSDHFYTTSSIERDAALGNEGPAIALGTLITTMQQIYDQAHIFVQLFTTQHISFPPGVDVDIGRCVIGSTTSEQDDLFKHRDFVGAEDIVVYFVRTTIPAANGCAAHPDGQPGAVVVRNGTQFTLAHEVGHILGLQHVNDNSRLMTGNGTGNINVQVPVLIASEVATMDESQYSVDI